MKPAVLLLLAVLASVAASYLVCSLVLVRPAPQAAAPASGAELERLAVELRGLQQGQAELVRKLEGLESELATRPSGEARVPMADIEAAVARALAERGASAAAAQPASAPAAQPKSKRSAAQALIDLRALAGSWEDAQKLWKALRDEGLVDEVLGLMEQAAKDNPGDAQLQVDLGKAYLQKLFTVPAGPEQGTWAMRADKAFDAALAIDDRNWPARFSKAVSLSNWPAFLGKQGEAARQFETLLEQQSREPARPEHAQTFFFLGNLYQSMGKSDQALATWRHGLEQFPGNAQLQTQIDSAEHH